ncbi:CRAL/TRIO domain-containing protein [Tilletiaria anomala UBC 951]|uniref:CRAL/TRIO domain-containing protein n=1 Tax=Tilletiaria anomala (strain ATCC 24038 / CBS 436.72 / UBC 951) TaxID=1037660 RepID=A0A066VF41_TILAU|nr:CRAL/TRIO domain-containing protein [Tilletiaria anomala UBC 951]KDN40101.1 CRAL/TRIO domain-containing protein [Tilletiaria anomala UBC 951]
MKKQQFLLPVPGDSVDEVFDGTTSYSSAASTARTSISSSGSGFLDPSSAFPSIDSSRSEKGGSSSGSRSPRAFASRMLSRQSSRQSVRGAASDQASAGMAAGDATPCTSASGGNGGDENEYFLGTSLNSALQSLSVDAQLNSSNVRSPLRNCTDAPSSSLPAPACASKAARSPGNALPSGSQCVRPGWRAMPGHVGNLTAAQEKTLVAFAQTLQAAGLLHPFPTPEDPIDLAALSQPLHSATHDRGTSSDTATDTVSLQRIHLLRWLRARNWDLDAAKEMYAKAHNWKFDKAGLDLERKLAQGWVFEQEEDVAANGWRMYFHKTDKLGRPIFIQDLSNINTSTIFSIVTPEQIIEKFAVTLEGAMRYRYFECSKAAGRVVEDNFMILNVEGLGLSTFWTMKNQLQELISILDNNFPELSGRVQIINAPWVFATIFGYIKGWLPPATREKVDIKGADYRETLLEFIREEDLPKSMFGKCTCVGGNDANGDSASNCTTPPNSAATMTSDNGTGTGSCFRRAVSAGAFASHQCGRADPGPWSSSYTEFLLGRRASQQAEKLQRQAGSQDDAGKAGEAEQTRTSVPTLGATPTTENKETGAGRDETELKAAVEVKVDAVRA